MAETSLHTQRSDITSLKFNGKMGVKEENTAPLSELNLERFLHAVGDIIERFGLEILFYLPDTIGLMNYPPKTPIPSLFWWCWQSANFDW